MKRENIVGKWIIENSSNKKKNTSFSAFFWMMLIKANCSEKLKEMAKMKIFWKESNTEIFDLCLEKSYSMIFLFQQFIRDLFMDFNWFERFGQDRGENDIKLSQDWNIYHLLESSTLPAVQSGKSSRLTNTFYNWKSKSEYLVNYSFNIDDFNNEYFFLDKVM